MMDDVTLAILAGGMGRRMGMPKGNLRLGGRAILEYLHARWGWVGPTMVVTAPGVERPAGVEVFGREVVDAVAGQGPLRGMLTALDHAGTEIVLVTTVDMPGVTREMLLRLVEVVGKGSTLGVMYGRGGRVEPFPCGLRRGIRERVAERIGRGELSVARLVEEGIEVVEAEAGWGEGVWANLNRVEDLREFEGREA